MKKTLLALTIAGSFAASIAVAAVPLVSLVTVNLGTPVHLTPTGFDAASNPVPLAPSLCTVVGFPNVLALPTSLVTVTSDSTGVILTAVGAGTGTARWSCTNGSATAVSASFTVTVPWNVTQVGDTSP